MLRTRVFYFIVFVFTISLSYGQYEWTEGKLLLKNGEAHEGFIKIPMRHIGALFSVSSPKVAFKKEDNSIVEMYGKSQVKSISFNTYSPDPGHYEYAPLQKRKYRLFKKLITGKVNLYKRTVVIVDSVLPRLVKSKKNPEKEVWSALKYTYIDEYYVMREGEKKLTPLVSSKVLIGFKKRAMRYFIDCDTIVALLKEDLYEELDVIALVNDYNKMCD